MPVLVKIFKSLKHFFEHCGYCDLKLNQINNQPIILKELDCLYTIDSITPVTRSKCRTKIIS